MDPVLIVLVLVKWCELSRAAGTLAGLRRRFSSFLSLFYSLSWPSCRVSEFRLKRIPDARFPNSSFFAFICP